MIDMGCVTGKSSQRVIATCTKTLQCLKFELRECIMPQTLLRTLANPPPKWVPPRASAIVQNSVNWGSPCWYPTQTLTITISSITSIHIGKIAFSSYTSAPLLHTAFANNSCWVQLDDCVFALVSKLRKLGSKLTLEVAFIAYLTPGLLSDYKGFLSKPREECLVKIVERPSGLVTELSVRFLFLFVSHHLF